MPQPVLTALFMLMGERFAIEKHARSFLWNRSCCIPADVRRPALHGHRGRASCWPVRLWAHRRSEITHLLCFVLYILLLRFFSRPLLLHSELPGLPFSCFQLCLQLYIVFSVPFSLGGQFLLHLFLLRCLCRTVDCFTSLRFLVVVILQRAAVVHHTTMHFQLGSHRIGLDHGRAAPKRPSAPLAGQAVCEEP